MSVGADSLMGSVDMSKLLDKETLEKGRVKRDGANVQVKDLVKAMIDSEPCLFHNSSDNLIPVSSRFTVWVGGAEINDYLLTKQEANQIAQEWKDKGHKDVCVEEVK